MKLQKYNQNAVCCGSRKAQDHGSKQQPSSSTGFSPICPAPSSLIVLAYLCPRQTVPGCFEAPRRCSSL